MSDNLKNDILNSQGASTQNSQTDNTGTLRPPQVSTYTKQNENIRAPQILQENTDATNNSK